jgi:hypothetical protein
VYDLDVRQLTEQQAREVLARAEEIHFGGDITSDAVLRAAEEAGLSREAVEQALRERFQHLEAPPHKGELVFAKSGDGCFYVAEVLDATPDAASVRFLAGGTRNVGVQDMRQASFTPGQRLTVNWPGYGWHPASVISYDVGTGELKVRGWAAETTVSTSDVRLEAESESPGKGALVKAYMAGLFCGGVIGAVVTWWLMR